MKLSSFKSVATGLALTLMSGAVMAAPKLSETLEGVGGEVSTFIPFVKLILGVIGFIFFAIGIMNIRKDTQQPGQGHLKNGIIGMLVGAGLMAAPWLFAMTTETIADGEGDNASSLTSKSF